MLSHFLIKASVAYFVLGVALGMYMGFQEDFRLMQLHVHVYTLGWLALAFVALTYRAFPALEQGWLPRAHCWLHNLGLPLFMGGIAHARLTNDPHFAPIAIGSIAMSLGIGLYAVHVFITLRGQRPRTSSPRMSSPELHQVHQWELP